MKSLVDIGLIVAMKEEADIIASVLDLNLVSSTKSFYNKYSNKENNIIMLTPGNDKKFSYNGKPLSRVGKVSAGVITTILILNYSPKIIINLGTAGGIGPKIKVGDIVVADYVTNHDIRFPFHSYNKWAERKIKLQNNHKLKFIKSKYKTGTVTSAEAFNTLPDEWNIINNSNAIAKDMEAAGVIQALEILNYTTPCYIIKAITDILDRTTSEDKSSEMFISNFNKAMDNLSQFINEIIKSKEKLYSP